MTILELLQEDGIRAKYAASTHGGEYKSSCPICGGDDRFCCWPNRKDSKKTVWWCRQCDKGGDDIEYLKHVRTMPYPEACTYLGRQASVIVRQQPKQAKLATRKVEQPSETWTKTSSAFVDWAGKTLWENPSSSVWDRLVDLEDETVKYFRLGLNPKPLYCNREEWGLKIALKDDGTPKKLWLPAGLVIPHFVDGVVVQVKLRPTEAIAKTRYWNLRSGTPCFIPCRGDIFVVVESDLDAMLLWQEVRDIIGVVSLGSLTNPDEETVNLLSKAKGLLIALDSDAAGGKKTWNWWLKYFPNSKRCIIPKKYGKDPGEAYQKKLNLRTWVDIGIDNLKTLT